MTPDLQALMNMIGSTDQGYSSGQQYAQSIAGGQNVPGMIAPGVSYSAARPEGYTQADLQYYNPGPAPVMPSAPTQGTPFSPNEGFVQMPSAPQGVAMPTKFGALAMPIKVPGMEDFDGEGMSPIPLDLTKFNPFGLGIKPEQVSATERYSPIIKDQESLKNLTDLFNANTPITPVIEDLPSVGSSPIDFSFNPFVDINVPESVIPTPEPSYIAPPFDTPFRPDPIQFESEPFLDLKPYQPVTTIEDYDIPVDVIPELPVVSLQDLPTTPVGMPFTPNDPMPSVSMQDYNDQLIKELLDPNSNRLPTKNFGGYGDVRSFLR